MINESVTIEQVLKLLNELVKLDPDCVAFLVEGRVSCNEAIANHPTVQVSDYAGSPSVGLLGILNGIFGIDEKGYGPISAYFEDDGTLTKFTRTAHKTGPDSA